MNIKNKDFKEEYEDIFHKGSHLRIMADSLLEKKNPCILECGVERGTSTKAFVWLAEKLNGHVYSIDIDNCSKVVFSRNWTFLQSDDREIDFVLGNFKEVKEKGADLIYIDSYHENFHVEKLLNLYFEYVKKDGSIFVDDIDSFPFREKKDIWNSIVYDLTDDVVKEFYYNNSEKTIYTKYFGENGLGNFYKTAKLFEKPNPKKKIWNYNIILKLLYPYLRKIKKFIKL
jgi:hypothetical protein